MGRVNRVLDWAAEAVGVGYFLALAGLGVAAIVLVLTLTIATHQWLGLIVLALPGLWLVMWLTD